MIAVAPRPRRRAELLGLVTALALALAPSRADADQAPEVSVRIDPCVGAAPAEVRRLFAQELAAALPAARLGSAEGGTQVGVRCAGAVVEIAVLDPLTGKLVVRELDLGATPVRARPRVLAIAMAELLWATWAELAQPGAPRSGGAAAGARAVASADVRRRLEGHTATGRGEAVVTAEWGGPGPMWLAGARLSVAGRRVGFAAGLVAGSARVDVAAGQVATSAVYIDAAGCGWLGRGRIRVRWAVGARAGVVTMRGEPDRPSVRGESVSGPAAGPLVRIGAEVRLGGLALSLGLESGVQLLSVAGTAQGMTVAAVDGPWLAAQGALGWSW
jgi:hypothetical protein